MNNTRIPVYSEQEHEIDIEEETIEDADISPHTKVVEIEPLRNSDMFLRGDDD